jgi:putative glutamine amidotransferase
MSTRIGMIAYASCKEAGRVVAPVDYIRAVERTGASVLVAPPGPSALALLDVVQGLVLTGGGDIDPARYGAQPHTMVYGVDAERDACELAVIEAALVKRLPILAICRGMQLLNVALGGTLHQHIPDLVGEDIAHRTVRSAELCSNEHDVRIAPDAAIAEICGGPRFKVASTHHQACDKLGRGVTACAWADDGIVEAISLTDHPHVIAVQWHPELTASTDTKQQRLFEWLVRTAREA